LKKTSCRHKVAAIALASGAALAITGGTAFAQPDNHPDDEGHQKVDSKNASIGIGAAQIDQSSGVTNFSVAASNSGLNEAHNGVEQGNGNSQTCNANTSGGHTLGLGVGVPVDEGEQVKGGSADATGGNVGGDCANDATNSNEANPEATILTGAASASNDTATTVDQTNSGGVDVSSDNSGNVDPSGARRIHQSGASVAAGFLGVTQHSSVENNSIAVANSGGNSAGNHVDQNNWNSQHGNANTSGGLTGAIGLGGDATASGGNSGGSASNTASNSNSASPKASITTGDASATNSTTTHVTQSNSGGVSVQSSNSGSVG
jgi:hypothetical protein